MLERLTWFRQASFRWRDEERTIYIDPWGTPGDAPPADVIVITHAHHDHFCIEDIDRLSTPSTKLVAPHDVAKDLSGDVTPVAPGESAGMPRCVRVIRVRPPRSSSSTTTSVTVG